jgi:hypothetical protein
MFMENKMMHSISVTMEQVQLRPEATGVNTKQNKKVGSFNVANIHLFKPQMKEDTGE